MLSVLYRTSLALYSIFHVIYSYLCSLLVILSIVFLFDSLSSEFEHLFFFSASMFPLNCLSMLWHLPVMLTFPPVLMTVSFRSLINFFYLSIKMSLIIFKSLIIFINKILYSSFIILPIYYLCIYLLKICVF